VSDRTPTAATRPRLSKEQWTDAALAAMAAQGAAGINVEQLARTLDTTKGSFYHHFENRHALLDAALARWEQIIESDLIEADVIADPRERLIESSIAGVDTSFDGFVELALASSIDDPAVAQALRRVNARRIDYLSTVLEELGVAPRLTRARAIGGLATYLGLYQLQHVTGQRFSTDELREQITHAIDSMLAP
jgi:AcrR family transcriptional regulator